MGRILATYNPDRKERMDEEWEQYLGRAKHERIGEGYVEDDRNGFYLRHLLTEIGDLILRIRRTLKGLISKEEERKESSV